MSIRKTECFVVVCDFCNQDTENSDYIVEHYSTKEEAVSEQEYYDWKKTGRAF